MKTTLTFNRANPETKFFNTSNVDDSDPRKVDLLLFLHEHEQNQTMTHEDTISADGKNLDRVLTWKSKEAKEAFEASFKLRFQWFHDLRTEYLTANDITLIVTTEE